jgi:hypothetical protein
MNSLVLLLAAALGVTPAPSPVGPMQAGPVRVTLSAPEVVEPARVLSSDDLEGRAVATPGGAKAIDYLARQFAAIGLAPLGDKGYAQSFEVSTGVEPGPKNSLSLVRSGVSTTFERGKEYTPISFTDSGEARGDVVFVGYGISAPELHYDDYAGHDVKGKIVLAMTHEPREKDQTNPFRKPEAYRYTEVRYKAFNAREHGARALILVSDPVNHETDRLFALQGGGGQTAGILLVNVTRSVADRILASPDRPADKGSPLLELQRAIDREFRPRSTLLAGSTIALSVDVTSRKGKGANVIGLLTGTDPGLKSEAIVVGAHFDALGRGGENSLAPDQVGKVHHGADDNASGVAGVLAVARTFSKSKPKRSIVFACFDGEETGALGSGHYVKHPTWPLEKTYAMVNLDSIGRLSGNRVYVHGVDSAKELRTIVERAASGSKLELKMVGDAYGPSDHTSFYVHGRPVAFFFTGPHADYHRPTDTSDKLEPEGIRRIAQVVARTVADLASRPAPLTFVKLAGKPTMGRGSGGGGYGAYFGSIPDFSESPVPGVKLTGVRTGSPAEKAGIRGGDTLVAFGGMTIRNLHDLTFALKARRPGDTVEVRYLRAGKELRTNAVLEERR